MTPITRQTRAVLQSLDDANCSLSATALCKRKPFVGLYSNDELRAEVLEPMLKAGLITARERQRCVWVYTITDAGLDALKQPDFVPQVAAPMQINRMTGTYDNPPRWPVAAERGHHPHLFSRGF